MYSEFGSVAVFLALGFLFVTVSLFMAGLIRPNRPSDAKKSTYECGELPIGSGRVQFNMRFYLIAFIFVIFDVEVVFVYPVATVFRDCIAAGSGLIAFTEIALFIGILLVGFVYAWHQGALQWICGPGESKESGHSSVTQE